MDAQHNHFRRILHRLAIAALATLALIGLWQGYGAWWFEKVSAHGS